MSQASSDKTTNIHVNGATVTRSDRRKMSTARGEIKEGTMDFRDLFCPCVQYVWVEEVYVSYLTGRGSEPRCRCALDAEQRPGRSGGVWLWRVFLQKVSIL